MSEDIEALKQQAECLGFRILTPPSTRKDGIAYIVDMSKMKYRLPPIQFEINRRRFGSFFDLELKQIKECPK